MRSVPGHTCGHLSLCNKQEYCGLCRPLARAHSGAQLSGSAKFAPTVLVVFFVCHSRMSRRHIIVSTTCAKCENSARTRVCVCVCAVLWCGNSHSLCTQTYTHIHTSLLAKFLLRIRNVHSSKTHRPNTARIYIIFMKCALCTWLWCLCACVYVVIC